MPATRSASSRSTTARRGRPTRPDPPHPRDRWRPRRTAGPVCGATFDDKTCAERGAHYCEPRADRFVAFCAELLVHTAGPYARRRFVLEDWQELEIARPIFGEVIWSKEWRRYIRRYSVAYIVIARKNGKSELAAAMVLYLLVGDDEEAAEVYGAAADTKQARKVYQPVQRMVALSPLLRRRLTENKSSRRIYDDRSGSFYEIITADALGELGHNPHGFVLDEVLSQRDDSLWEAMRTAAGARAQPLFIAITTETSDPASFGATLIDEAERIQQNPRRAPHVFAWVRKTPLDVDPFDEANWYHANPALGTFKSIEAMREQALEARNEPAKENGFRQFQLNQRSQQVTRWMPLHVWDAAAGLVDEDSLAGRTCYAGLDLASTTDLAAWVLLFPPTDDDQVHRILWRFWTPEAQIPHLDKYTAGLASTWVAEGLLRATEGDWIDYEGDPDTGRSHHSLRGPAALAIHPQITADHQRFRIAAVGYDQAQATATAQHMQSIGLDPTPIYQGFALSPGLKEIMRLTKAGLLEHGGHPVARWNADSAEVKTDDQERIKLVKPQRGASGKRVDGIAGLATAIRVAQIHQPEAEPAPSVYETRGVITL